MKLDWAIETAIGSLLSYIRFPLLTPAQMLHGPTRVNQCKEKERVGRLTIQMLVTGAIVQKMYVVPDNKACPETSLRGAMPRSGRGNQNNSTCETE
ncbi:hypothetical protein RvY_05845 [Ramazzottius varieornatus]|uniref:Uncharacterized protein n=1 Tax=Ramazzottius varieornatus TaxID=947166 RepID=A0A1D1UWG0_RAMVA|nr:hypothetical protein RvY_05845 [Ramazzottius varieornatus]